MSTVNNSQAEGNGNFECFRNEVDKAFTYSDRSQVYTVLTYTDAFEVLKYDNLTVRLFR